MTLALFVPIVWRFDFYYDLNDDVLIKDILSGVYSGAPDGHTMQLLYPLGLLLSLAYRGLSIPVFGVFLVLCQFGSIWVIGFRTAQRCRKWQCRMLALAAEGAFFAAAFGVHLVFLQYTITAGMLAAAAIFWLLTSDLKNPAADARGRSAFHPALAFWKENIPAFFLYGTAFCLRTEMALLLLPLAGAAGLCCWGQEKKIFTKANAAKYLTAFGTLLLGMALLLGWDSLAYSRNGWPAFRQFFDARTELYDYQKDFVDDFARNAEDYQALGVSQTRQRLLANYNFGADDGIDAALLTALREKAEGRPEAGGFFRKSIAEGLWSLQHQHWLGSADFPLNLVWILCALCALVPWYKKKYRYLLWQIPLGVCTAASLWMFLLLRDRPVDRVFHPLYLGQAVLFVGILLRMTGREASGSVRMQTGGEQAADRLPGGLPSPGQNTAEFAAKALAMLVFCLCMIQLPKTWPAVEAEQERREEVNAVHEAVMAYCSTRPAQLFLEDVYSTVSFSEKIAVDRNKPFNYDLLGGWLVKSPLTLQKLAAFGFSSMEEAVRAGGNVKLLAEKGSPMEWLEESLAEKGYGIQVIRVGTIADSVDIYQVLSEEVGEMLYGKD